MVDKTAASLKNAHVTKNQATKKISREGMEHSKVNLSDWYNEIMIKGQLIEYYSVSGCYILKPTSYAIWEQIQKNLDGKLKAMGIRNCYFPMFVTEEAMTKEKDHIDDFIHELAFVATKSDPKKENGKSSVNESRIALRPTSEAVMYPTFKNWVSSHRDLPLLLNQWCNIVRMETKETVPFLRSKEFLWQEGHTAHATREEAQEMAKKGLDVYIDIFENQLAVPVIPGIKTKKETFAGAEYTLSCENIIPENGRGIQGCTSHFLGQNFSKMFDIKYKLPNDSTLDEFVYQTCFGFTTRSIGIIIMTHGDDKGLVIPPNISEKQVIIIPCGIKAKTTDEEKQKLFSYCNDLKNELESKGIRAACDAREHITPGVKFNESELKGIPCRIEIGFKEVEKNMITMLKRNKLIKLASSARENAVEDVKQILTEIQKEMLDDARERVNAKIKKVTIWTDFIEQLNNLNCLLAPFCGVETCEAEIKKLSSAASTNSEGRLLMGAKSLNIPHEQPELAQNTTCISPNCENLARNFTLFGRCY